MSKEQRKGKKGGREMEGLRKDKEQGKERWKKKGVMRERQKWNWRKRNGRGEGAGTRREERKRSWPN